MARIAAGGGPMKTMPGVGAGLGERRRSRTGSRSRDGSPRRRSRRAASMMRVDRRDSSRAPAAGPIGTASSARSHVQRAARRPRSRPRPCAMPRRRAVRDDAAGDLAAVGDQDLVGTSPHHIRKTPKRVGSSGAFSAAESARPSTRARVGRVDDAVVPQPGGGVVGMALRLVLRADRRLEGLLVLAPARSRRAPRCCRAAPCASTLAACSPPITEMRAFGHIHRKRGAVGPAAHAVIAGAEGAADDDGELRHRARWRPRSPSWRRPWRCRRPRISRPTMKPVMFCRNTSGMPRWAHSSMKCAPFSALSENRMPLLATMPTG